MTDNDSRSVASGAPFIDPAWTVRDVTTRYPASVAVFEVLKVETCCDAGRSLDEAATRAGITRELLIDTLQLWIRGLS